MENWSNKKMWQQESHHNREIIKTSNEMPSDAVNTCGLVDVTETIELGLSDSDSVDLDDIQGNRMLMHLINTDKSLSEEERQDYAKIMGLSPKPLTGSNIKTVRIRNGIFYHVLDKKPSKTVTIAFKVESDGDKAFDKPTTKTESSKVLQQQVAVTAYDKSTTTTTTTTTSANDEVKTLRMAMTLPDTTTDATNSDGLANVARTKQHPSQKKRRLEVNDVDDSALKDLNRLADFALLRKNERACQLIEELRFILFN